MPLYQSDAFVLRTYQLGEADQIVVFFTRDFANCAPWRVAVTTLAAIVPAIINHYCCSRRLCLVVLPRRSTASIRWTSCRRFRGFHEDFERLRCGLYMTELLDVTTHEREPLPELFALFQLALEQLLQTTNTACSCGNLNSASWALLATPHRCCIVPAVPASSVHTNGRSAPCLGGLLCSACAPEVRQTLLISPATRAYLCGAIDSAAARSSRQ